MILTDSGPLVAIIDRGEAHHAACVEILSELTGPMLTSWPAFTEAMYLLGDAGGWTAQSALWRIVEQTDLQIADPSEHEQRRMRKLMEKYRDQPMDLADASLVAIAETRNLHEVFTLDRRHFMVYRLDGRRTLRLLPQQL